MLLIPTIQFSDYSNIVHIYPGFGLYLRLDLDDFQLLDINFVFPLLIYDLILIGSLILLIILLILCNKLKNGGVLGLGIPCAIILSSYLIYNALLGIIEFFIFGSSVYFNSYLYYIHGFAIALVVLGLFMILKERKSPHTKVNKSNTSEIMELKTKLTLVLQTIRLSYLIIIGSLIFLLLVPHIFDYRSYSDTITITFFYGLETHIDLNSLGLLSPILDPYLLIIAIPLIPAIVLLIILLALYKKLNKGGLLGIGIPCALLMITSPVLLSVIYLLYLPSLSLGPSYYYMTSLSTAIVVLGLILKVKELKMSNMRINKVINPDKG